MLQKNFPYKPPQKIYDFTKMTDAQIEAELLVLQAESEAIFSNIIQFPTKG